MTARPYRLAFKRQPSQQHCPACNGYQQRGLSCQVGKDRRFSPLHSMLRYQKHHQQAQNDHPTDQPQTGFPHPNDRSIGIANTHDASASDKKTQASYYDRFLQAYLDFITSRLACLFFGFFLGAYLVALAAKYASKYS